MWLLITFVKYLAPNVREEQRMQAAGPLTSCRSLGFDKHKTFGPPHNDRKVFRALMRWAFSP